MVRKHPLPDRPGSARGATGLLAMAALAAAGFADAPLTRTGPCPELKREAFPMGDEVVGRYFNTNPNGDFTVKSNFGTIQSALTPEQSVNCAQVPAELKAEVWAHENTAGNIKALMGFAFDERGRMWAVESFDYPNNILTPFTGNDRIVILEDTDGDRVADKHTVFVSGLNIPQGIELTPQGVAVAMAPLIVLFEDRNGDDKADDPKGRTLYQGFGCCWDTHGAATSLRWGLDGWLYGDVGFNGGTINGVAFKAAVWRAKLDGSKFEVFAPTRAGNAASLGMMEDGQWFMSGANCEHTQHVVIPGILTQRLDGGNCTETKHITKDLMQGDFAGRFTAATDHEIYTARLLPKAYWNRAAFVSEGTAHLVNMDFVKRSGSSWVRERNAAMPNLIASTDAWTAPIMSKVGPDGAVWVLDYYTYLYLHSGMPGPVQGKGGAWNHPLRSKSRQRIYRVLPADGKVDPVMNLANAGYPELVAAFRNTNLHWRLSAQKMIVRKAATAQARDEVEKLLLEAVKSRGSDELGLDPLALHAVWTAHNLGLLESHAAAWDPVLKGLLLHPSYSVRMNVLKAMPRTAASAQAIKDQGRVNDPDAHVRLQALLALSQMPKVEGVALWTQYRDVDMWPAEALKLAGDKVGATPTQPAIPPLQPAVGVGDASRAPFLPRGLEYAFTARGGLRLMPNGHLPAGVFTLADLRGKVVGTSSFDGRRWTRQFPGLRTGAYLYAFRGENGDVRQGRMMPAPE